MMTITAFAKRTCMLLLLAGMGLSVIGCTSSVTVKSDFPSPLTYKTPLRIGLYYPQNFSQYEYKEESEDRAKWIIKSGEAHQQVLDTVFSGMFTDVEHVDGTTAGNVDLIFEPQITDFQYAVPRETRVNIYEIWIKYNFKVYNSQGELLADWISSAYGKTPTAFLKSNENAMEEAVVMALRDLGANMVVTFRSIPEIKAWLAQAGSQS